MYRGPRIHSKSFFHKIQKRFVRQPTEPFFQVPSRPIYDFKPMGWITLSLVNGGLAETKGREKWQWMIASLILGPFATAYIVISEAEPKTSQLPPFAPAPFGYPSYPHEPHGPYPTYPADLHNNFHYGNQDQNNYHPDFYPPQYYEGYNHTQNASENRSADTTKESN